MTLSTGAGASTSPWDPNQPSSSPYKLPTSPPPFPQADSLTFLRQTHSTGDKGASVGSNTAITEGAASVLYFQSSVGAPRGRALPCSQRSTEVRTNQIQLFWERGCPRLWSPVLPGELIPVCSTELREGSFMREELSQATGLWGQRLSYWPQGLT